MQLINPLPSHQEPKRFILAGILLTVALLVWVGLWRILQPPRSPRTGLRPAATWVKPSSEQELAAVRDKAKWLRERFAVWAHNHVNELLSLRHCAPNDTNTLLQVYRTLPYEPSTSVNGFDSSDMEVGENEFCWNVDSTPAVTPPSILNDPLEMDRKKQGSKVREEMMYHNFATQHDIALGFSTNSGPICYTIWASGRVTETHTPLIHVNDNAMLESTETEIVPPYDFIH